MRARCFTVLLSFGVIACTGSSEDRMAVKRLEVQVAQLQERVARLEETQRPSGPATAAASTSAAVPPTTPTAFPTSTPRQAEAAPTTAGIETFTIIEASARATETNDTWWRYGWRLTVRNNSPDPQDFRAEIQFVDGEGYVVDSARTGPLSLGPGQTNTFTDSELVSYPGAKRVTAVKAILKGRG